MGLQVFYRGLARRLPAVPMDDNVGQGATGHVARTAPLYARCYGDKPARIGHGMPIGGVLDAQMDAGCCRSSDGDGDARG